jgi:hypothetical protein
VNDNGYIELYAPDHPGNVDGYVLLHRVVMENYLSRFLLPTDVVHHMNEIKDDNRIENLWLTNVSEHTYIHRISKTHSREVRSKIRQKRLGRKFKRDHTGKFS